VRDAALTGEEKHLDLTPTIRRRESKLSRQIKDWLKEHFGLLY
jgi:hypothetical protein